MTTITNDDNSNDNDDNSKNDNDDYDDDNDNDDYDVSDVTLFFYSLWRKILTQIHIFKQRLPIFLRLPS